MNPREPFAFSAAPWPVLLVDARGAILQANKSATDIFGAGLLNGGHAGLSAMWDPANAQTCLSFLSAGLATGAVMSPLKLAAPNNDNRSWLACLSRADGTDAILIQLFPDQQPPSRDVKNTAAETQA